VLERADEGRPEMNTREELRQFIIEECCKKPHLVADAERVADFILSQPSMQSESGVRGFLDGYLGTEQS
jgi:hypothetical protein